MPGPIAWLAANPQTIPLIATGVGSIYETVFPDKAKQIQLEVLEDQKNFRRMLSRQARGIFTSAEHETLARGAEPVVNRVAGNVAARGLGSSPAGAQIIARAQQEPFIAAQQGAQAALPAANQQSFQMASLLATDDSFYEDLGATVQNLVTLAELGDAPDTDPDVNNAIGMLQEIFDFYEHLGKTTPGALPGEPKVPSLVT